jgi:hypothetical protein
MRVVDLLPDVDYASVAAAALAGPIRPEELGSHLSRAWAQAYRSRLPQTSLLEFDSDGARFLFDLASAAGAERADRTVAAWGRSRPAPRPRDQAYQRGYPSPQGRADRPLDKGHMVAHAAGGTFGPGVAPVSWTRLLCGRCWWGVLALVGDGAGVVQGRVAALAVVEDLDEVEHGGP